MRDNGHSSFTRSLIFAFLAVLLLFGCSQPKKSEIRTVVTTFLPVEVMSLDIVHGLNNVQVVNLAPSSAGCPQHYTLTPSDLTALRNADVVVMHGLGLDPWIESHLPALRQAGVKVIALSEALDSEMFTDSDHEADGEHHDHNGLPHTWTSPDLARKELVYLADELGDILPDLGDSITVRRNRISAELDTLTEEYRAFGDRHEGAKVALFHDSFTLMLSRIHLDVALILQPDPDVPPGPRKTSSLINQLKGEQIEALISEPQIDVNFAQMIQKGSGRQIVSLNSLVTGVGEPGMLVETLRSNLEELEVALEEKR